MDYLGENTRRVDFPSSYFGQEQSDLIITLKINLLMLSAWMRINWCFQLSIRSFQQSLAWDEQCCRFPCLRNEITNESVVSRLHNSLKIESQSLPFMIKPQFICRQTERYMVRELKDIECKTYYTWGMIFVPFCFIYMIEKRSTYSWKEIFISWYSF